MALSTTGVQARQSAQPICLIENASRDSIGLCKFSLPDNNKEALFSTVSGTRGPMAKAPAYGAGDSRFESWRVQSLLFTSKRPPTGTHVTRGLLYGYFAN